MENGLEHLEEFQKILSKYHVSEDSQTILSGIKLALLAAPTSSGRNTIIRELIKSDDYKYLVSDTTRQPRINDGVPEKNGVEYWFRSEKEILADLRDGKYLEAAIIHNQQVSGISIRELKKARHEHKIAITDIEIAGVSSILKIKPDTAVLFVLPPDFEEWQRRIKHRGTMFILEYRRRLESASQELSKALEHDYYKFVINDTVPHAVKQIINITKLGRVDQNYQAKGRELAEQLRDETIRFLKTK